LIIEYRDYNFFEEVAKWNSDINWYDRREIGSMETY